jgi:predicted nucleotidyltransferase
LAIFGSHARNEQAEDSDLDILVEFDEKIGLQFIDLADELELLLGRRIDLVSKGGIKEKYFQNIKQDLIYV